MVKFSIEIFLISSGQNTEEQYFAYPNYAPYRACLAKVNNSRILAHQNIRLRHEGSSLGRIIRESKVFFLNSS